MLIVFIKWLQNEYYVRLIFDQASAFFSLIPATKCFFSTICLASTLRSVWLGGLYQELELPANIKIKKTRKLLKTVTFRENQNRYRIEKYIQETGPTRLSAQYSRKEIVYHPPLLIALFQILVDRMKL